MCRIGACGEENQNFVVYVKTVAEKADAPNDIIAREGGRWQGGASVMVALGLCFRGDGTLHIAPKGDRGNSDPYLKMIKDLYGPDRHEHYCIPPECRLRQEGGTPRTSNAAKKYRRKRPPNFREKNSRAACSPDLDAPTTSDGDTCRRESRCRSELPRNH